MTRIARGDRITRTKGSEVHVVGVQDRAGRIHGLCGAIVYRPTKAPAALSGADCETCVAIAGQRR